MDRKACSTNQKKNMILVSLNIKYRLNSTFLVKPLNKFHSIATKSDAGRTLKVTELRKRLIEFEQVRNNT